jgi:hypothetical protein
MHAGTSCDCQAVHSLHYRVGFYRDMVLPVDVLDHACMEKVGLYCQVC